MSRHRLLGAITLCLTLTLAALPALADGLDPYLDVTETALGSWTFQGTDTPAVTLQVAPNQELNFSWWAYPADTGVWTFAYRYGWDVGNPQDPFDPGWVTPDFQPDATSAPPRAFASGVHNLVIQVKDDVERLTQAILIIEVQPGVPVAEKSWSAVKSMYGR